MICHDTHTTNNVVTSNFEIRPQDGHYSPYVIDTICVLLRDCKHNVANQSKKKFLFLFLFFLCDLKLVCLNCQDCKHNVANQSEYLFFLL